MISNSIHTIQDTLTEMKECNSRLSSSFSQIRSLLHELQLESMALEDANIEEVTVEDSTDSAGIICVCEPESGLGEENTHFLDNFTSPDANSSHEVYVLDESAREREFDIASGNLRSNVDQVFDTYSQRAEPIFIDHEVMELLHNRTNFSNEIRLMPQLVFIQLPFDPGEKITPTIRFDCLNTHFDIPNYFPFTLYSGVFSSMDDYEFAPVWVGPLFIASIFKNLEVKFDSLFLDCISKLDSDIIPFKTWMGMCVTFGKSGVASTLFKGLCSGEYSVASLLGNILQSILSCILLGAMSILEFGENPWMPVAGQRFDKVFQQNCCSNGYLKVIRRISIGIHTTELHAVIDSSWLVVHVSTVQALCDLLRMLFLSIISKVHLSLSDSTGVLLHNFCKDTLSHMAGIVFVLKDGKLSAAGAFPIAHLLVESQKAVVVRYSNPVLLRGTYKQNLLDTGYTTIMSASDYFEDIYAPNRVLWSGGGLVSKLEVENLWDTALRQMCSILEDQFSRMQLASVISLSLINDIQLISLAHVVCLFLSEQLEFPNHLDAQYQGSQVAKVESFKRIHEYNLLTKLVASLGFCDTEACSSTCWINWFKFLPHDISASFRVHAFFVTGDLGVSCCSIVQYPAYDTMLVKQCAIYGSHAKVQVRMLNGAYWNPSLTIAPVCVQLVLVHFLNSELPTQNIVRRMQLLFDLVFRRKLKVPPDIMFDSLMVHFDVTRCFSIAICSGLIGYGSRSTSNLLGISLYIHGAIRSPHPSNGFAFYASQEGWKSAAHPKFLVLDTLTSIIKIVERLNILKVIDALTGFSLTCWFNSLLSVHYMKAYKPQGLAKEIVICFEMCSRKHQADSSLLSRQFPPDAKVFTVGVRIASNVYVLLGKSLVDVDNSKTKHSLIFNADVLPGVTLFQGHFIYTIRLSWRSLAGIVLKQSTFLQCQQHLVDNEGCRYGSMVLYPNLEDKVLFEGRGIVMNLTTTGYPFGNLLNYIWDPG